eukprot:1843133-Rhodomonas_salina.1
MKFRQQRTSGLYWKDVNATSLAVNQCSLLGCCQLLLVRPIQVLPKGTRRAKPVTLQHNLAGATDGIDWHLGSSLFDSDGHGTGEQTIALGQDPRS